jgi:hypothetical protein
MTRETKLGLVVSGSFLCLVGIVLFSKLKEQGSSAAGDGQESVVRADLEPTPVEDKSGDQKPTSVRAIEIPGSAGATKDQVKKKESVQPNVHKKPEGASSIQTAGAKSEADLVKSTSVGGLPTVKKKEAAEEVVEEQSLIGELDKEKPSSSTGPATSQSAATLKTTQPPSLPAFPGFHTNSFETTQSKQEQVKVDPAKSSGPPSIDFSSNPSTSAPMPGKADSQPPKAATEQPADNKQNATGQATAGDGQQSAGSAARNTRAILPPPPAQDFDTQTGPAPAGKEGKKEVTLEAGSLTGFQGTGPASSPRTESVPSATSGVPAVSKADQPTSIPSLAPGAVKIKQITARPEGGKEEPKKDAPVGPPTSQTASPSTPSADHVPLLTAPSPGREGGPPAATSNAGSVSTSGSTVDKSGQQGPRAQTSVGTSASSTERPSPLLGAPVPAVNSSITAAQVPKETAPSPASRDARVESYDEDKHVCGANETFRTISQTYYQSDRFADALLLFNRNHPLAADGMRQDPPRLQPGQAVYVPPASILEKYYAATITDPTPGQPSLAPRPTSQDPVAAIRPTPAVPPAALTPKPAVAAVSEKTYRVGGNGEMMREVARRALGDGDRWTEIYQLNLRYDPKEPVPAGTELRLPNDARLESAP